MTGKRLLDGNASFYFDTECKSMKYTAWASPHQGRSTANEKAIQISRPNQEADGRHAAEVEASASAQIQDEREDDSSAKDSASPLVSERGMWYSFSKLEPYEIPNEFPALPDILNPSMAQAALTHQANGDGSDNYEIFEFRGDAWLQVIATEFLCETFPNLEEGRLSHLRELCVRNATLAELALHYGLDARAHLPPEFNRQGLRNGKMAGDKARIKVLGNLMEAYVGALTKSDPDQGVQRASNWLKGAWTVLLKDKFREAERDKTVGKYSKGSGNAKDALAKAIGWKGVVLDYKDIPAPGLMDKNLGLPLFKIGVYLTGYGEKGKLLGQGVAHGKKKAGMKAAEAVLNQPTMMDRYTGMKRVLKLAYEKEAFGGQ